MQETTVQVQGMTFTVRTNTLDAGVLHDVIAKDEYRLKEMFQVGLRPKFVLDIGGHVGGFVGAAAQLWPEATILTFEAYAPNYQLLARNIIQFPKARAFNAAVIGDNTRSQVRFQCSDQPANTGGGGLSAGGELVVPAVGVQRLLEMIAPNRIHLLKLDCEGCEEEILAEMRRLDVLKTVGIICGEWHGAARREALERILAPTHTFNNVPHPNPAVLDLGLFFSAPAS